MSKHVMLVNKQKIDLSRVRSIITSGEDPGMLIIYCDFSTIYIPFYSREIARIAQSCMEKYLNHELARPLSFECGGRSPFTTARVLPKSIKNKTNCTTEF